MIFSILLYLLFGVIFYLLGYLDWKVSSRNECKKKSLTSYSWQFIILFTLISGLRYRLGADCESYVSTFLSGDNSIFLNRGEYLFSYVSDFLRNLGIGRIVYLGFWAFIEILFLYNAIKTRKFILPFFGLVMMLGPFYYDMMNGLRQIVATCIFIYAIQQKIDNEKWKKYLLLISISFLIHHSAFILFAFVLIPNKEYFNNRYAVITAIIVCAILGQQGWIIQYLNLGAAQLDVDDMMGYEGYLERIEYFTEDLASVLSYGPRRIVVLIISVAIVWYYPQMQKHYNDKFLMFCFSGFVIYALFSENLLTAVHSSMSRPFLYFKFFKLICNAYLLHYLKEKYQKKQSIIYYAVLFFSIIYMPLDNYAVATDPMETTLFKFIFMK